MCCPFVPKAHASSSGYTTRQFAMKFGININIVATCHASLLLGAVEFLIKVDSIMSWAANTFVDKMAEKLALFLSKCARQHYN